MNKFLVSLCFAFLALTGCSRLDIAFNWADTYIASKVDDYFDISSQQSKELKKDIQKDLQAIRAEVLPTWIDRLKEIQKEVDAGPLNEQRVSFYFSLFMKDIEAINARFSNTAVDFIATTNSTQLNFFDKAFKSKNSEDMDKARNLSKLQKEYRDKYNDYFEMFLGYLTKEQKAMIEDSVKTSPFPLELKIRNKEFVYNKFLKEKGSPEGMKAFVKDYYTHPAQYDMPEFQTAFLNYQQNLQSLVVKVMTSMNEEQKKNLRSSINEKTAQLEMLAKRG